MPRSVLKPVWPPQAFNTAGPRSSCYHLKGLGLALDELIHAMARAWDPEEWARGRSNPIARQQQAACRLRKKIGEAFRAAEDRRASQTTKELVAAWAQGCEEIRQLAANLCQPRMLEVSRAWCTQLKEAATRSTDHEREEQFKEVKRFYREASQGAAGKLHRHIKQEGLPQEEAQPRNGSTVCSPLNASEDQKEFWGNIWLVEDPIQQSIRPWFSLEDEEEGEHLGEVTGRQVYEASRKFKASTGLGVDRINPRLYGQVCEAGQEAIAGVVNHVERKLQWPAQVNLLIYFLMQKPEGGNRGVAKLPSLVRLWERVRYPVMAEWYRKAARDYDWACAGGTAEMAVWHQLLEQESLLPEDGARGRRQAGGAAGPREMLRKSEATPCVDMGNVLGSPEETAEAHLRHILDG